MKSWLASLLWGFTLVVIMLSFSVGLFITAFVALVPLLVLYVRLNRVWFAVTVAVAAAVSAALAGPDPLMLVTAALFLVTAVVVGELYRRRASAKTAMFAGIGAFFIGELLVLLVGYAAGDNLVDRFSRGMTDLFAQSGVEAIFSKDLLGDVVQMYVQMIPLLMILFAAMFVSVGHTLARRVLNRSGHAVAKMKPMREWMLPRALVWYYLAGLLLDLFFHWQPGSTISVVLLNAIPLFTFLFYLQGISFLYFVAHARGWNKALPILGIVLFPFLMNLISILGVFDTAFPVRDRIRKP